MSQLVILIVDDPSKVDDVINAWVEAGVTGASAIDTFGTGRLLPGELREGLPLFPSLSDLMQGREEQNRLIFSVVADNFNVDQLVTVTENIVGKLADHHTGIMFTMPVTKVWGLRPPLK
jgi:nitrogen regulatory protein PII